MKAIVIVNPHARSGDAKERAAQYHEDIEQRLISTGQFSGVDWVDTQHPLHATQLAQESAEQGYGCVIAAGGDGTVSEVINGLMRVQVRPFLGVLPWGTCNDFCSALSAAEQQRHDPFTLPLDVGQVTFDGMVRYSCLSVSIGLSSWANEQYQNAV